jgi:hypothetical protein
MPLLSLLFIKQGMLCFDAIKYSQAYVTPIFNCCWFLLRVAMFMGLNVI